MPFSARISLYGLAISLVPVLGLRAEERRPIDFNRDIRPILSENCFHCHGPDAEARKADLRLDSREAALKVLAPKHLDQSVVWRRINHSEPGERMPPQDSKRHLSSEEVDLIGQWIAQGADYQQHWAYQPPKRPPTPPGSDPVDHFVRRKLAEEGLAPAERAARATLIRRLSLDLIGLPPSPEEIAAFESDGSPRAYEALVDRLLANDQFGEHWARPWLDLARYADSNGFQADQLRDSWAYRDWVIDALNANMPFDQFTIEQLAGDLFENATTAQKIATGFHRTPTCNVEAGVIPEANRVNQVVDRVNTTATVWLGTTLECAQCHDHKYDPFSMEDYFGIFAYFNQTPVEVRNPSGKGVSFDFYGPKMALPLTIEEEREKQDLQAKVAGLRRRLKKVEKESPERESLQKSIDSLKARLSEIPNDTTLIMVELEKRRETRLMKRGNYQDLGATVEAAPPRALHPMDPSLPRNRLGFARWLMDPKNPLVGRVTVNRWWAQLFGQGLVRTQEDFGTQSSPPSHPDLLDWLAVEFMESDWDMKHLIKTMVLSETYQQRSNLTPRSAELDPENRLYARGPRFRMTAEMIRDNALAVSGLISLRKGGPPVMPHQPEGIWRQVGRNEPTWETADDDDRYRRGVYVIWRRAAPYPSFVNFDGPDRGACVVDRPRTNTPLQALTLLNDPAYVEIALALAHRVLTEVPRGSLSQRIAHAYRLVLGRYPQEHESRILASVIDTQKHEFTQTPGREKALIRGAANGAFQPRPEVDEVELAAWFFAANILLNLDETISKE